MAAIVLSGCASGPPGPTAPVPLVPVCLENPVLIPIADHCVVWETVVDVLDDYFKIEREEPVRLIGNTLTEGRIETLPDVSPTIFEPWQSGAAGLSQRVENTLQTLRRRAVVRVIPTAGGYYVELCVLKELEDMVRPEKATAGAATFRYDGTLTRIVNPVGAQEIPKGWIPQGRDVAMEQKILGHLRDRCGMFRPPPLRPAFAVPTGAAATSAAGPQTMTAYRPVLSCAENGDTSNWCEAPEGRLQGESGFSPRSGVCPLLEQAACDVRLDYQHFYSCRGMFAMGAALGVAAVLANTSLDEDFQSWHDARVRTTGTEDFAHVVKEFGNGLYMIPAFAAAALLGPQCRCPGVGAALNDWGDRCLRCVVVGGPPVLVFQWLLGASRPYETTAGSRWKPFDDTNAVSGHAFIGAIPFLAAGSMCDGVGFKLAMYSLSVLPAWARIIEDRHFLSQALLGWWFAQLAVWAVEGAEQSKRQFAVIPLVSGDTVGVGMGCAW